MNNSIKELENLITLNLQSTNNLKNEVEKKMNEKHDQLIEVSKGIIETLDTFDKVEEWFIERGLDKNEDSVRTKNRYNTVKTRLLNLLQKYGITKIEFPDNRLIIGLCEVVETDADKNRKNDEIISVVRSGYIRGNELIRAAQIIVVKN
jgi:molecular chaperone GrpE (heat shock protein)